MCSALILASLLGSASAKGYNRSRTKLAIPKYVGSPPANRGPTARIVGGAPPLPCACRACVGWGSALPPLCPAHSKATLNMLTRPALLHTPPAGAPVTPFEHNWVVLFRAGGFVCGASLIDEQWAMTAAHCTKGVAASSMQVGVHRHAYGWADNGEHDCAETVAIAEKHEHPEYNSATLENDITLLRLSQVHPLPHALANRRRLPYDNYRPRPPSPATYRPATYRPATLT